ncbi:MAG: LysR family transcriptional regulator, partial [Mesorhizobium sp.]
VEVFLDNALTDIAAERFDAGVRMGESVAKDMIAVRVGPDIRFAVVGAKSYFAKRPPPMTPQELTGHICINQRFSSNGGLWVWDFERDGRELKVRVDGQIILNGTVEILEAALEGFGLAYMPEDVAQAHLDSGRLVRVLDEWSPPWPGYHLYYPSRRQTSPAFALLVNVLRYSG